MIVQATLCMHFLPNKVKQKESTKQNLAIQKQFKDRIAVLTISYHNLGVE